MIDGDLQGTFWQMGRGKVVKNYHNGIRAMDRDTLKAQLFGCDHLTPASVLSTLMEKTCFYRPAPRVAFSRVLSMVSIDGLCMATLRSISMSGKKSRPTRGVTRAGQRIVDIVRTVVPFIRH